MADSYQACTDYILAIPWYKFLTGLTLNYQGKDISTMVDESDIFTNTEKVYLEAWFDLIGSFRKTYTAQPSHFSHDEYWDFFGSPPSTILPQLFDDLPADFFNSRSKKFNMEDKSLSEPFTVKDLDELIAEDPTVYGDVFHFPDAAERFPIIKTAHADFLNTMDNIEEYFGL
ncbi:uncharacterized protein J8A68_001451 [[Candida] subhashii]|uniref:Uncharacterized protein n=1 Tax=[Candida] subhashii TaxID=561895 RepID=A0A8J5UK21_9ASCO|nr:uncharacterized protein J8A68_001451 [[Candida] subhashii]KAG7665043.1 hypothetical protein J8A68_001451 [[Candida] subhashii]